MRIIFLGTPDFAVESLKAIAKTKHEIVGVVTQPDRARNRNVVSFCPVKQCALELGLNVYQFESIRKEGVEVLKSLNADIMITCAYGQILSEEILNMTKYGVYNVHASLLPSYRGSSPIQWAVIKGEKVTGITIMKTALGIDTGDILMQESLQIEPEETAGELFDRLAVLGGQTIVKAIDMLQSGNYTLTKQDEEKASHYPMFTKDSGKLDFSKSAVELVNFIRGTNPWPSAFCKLDNKLFKIWKARALRGDEPMVRKFVNQGEIVVCFGNLCVGCGKGEYLVLEEVQLEGAKRMSAQDFMRGHSQLSGVQLS